MEYVEKRIVVEDVDKWTGWFADPEPGLLHQTVHVAGELTYLWSWDPRPLLRRDEVDMLWGLFKLWVGRHYSQSDQR
jgi:hypothetical protein